MMLTCDPSSQMSLKRIKKGHIIGLAKKDPDETLRFALGDVEWSEHYMTWFDIKIFTDRNVCYGTIIARKVSCILKMKRMCMCSIQFSNEQLPTNVERALLTMVTP